MARVRLAQPSDCDALARLRYALWPEETSVEEHARELERILAGERIWVMPYVIFVAELDGALAGFAEVGLRSIADGCDPRRPAGYLEGWFVADQFRRRGIGTDLLRAAEEWARAQGCTEMGSDTSIDNTTSQRAHEALGFEVAERAVLYRKSLRAQ